MKVILLKDIKGVGKRFEEKEISNGYANNFLIPKKLVMSLSDASVASIKNLKEQGERAQEKRGEMLSQSISKLKNVKLTTSMKANENGSLFSSLNTKKISELLKKEGIEIDPEHIKLEEPIKETGTFEVPVSIGEGKETYFTLEVNPLD